VADWWKIKWLEPPISDILKTFHSEKFFFSTFVASCVCYFLKDSWGNMEQIPLFLKHFPQSMRKILIRS